MKEHFSANSPFLTSEKRSKRWAVPYHYDSVNGRVENILGKNQSKIAGKTILDLGCHYGTFAKAALQLGATHVKGIDTEEKLIASANQLFTQTGVDETQYDFSVDDALGCLAKQADDSVDVIFCLGIFYYIPDPLYFLKEMKRVARETIILDTFTARYFPLVNPREYRDGPQISDQIFDTVPVLFQPLSQAKKQDYTITKDVFQGRNKPVIAMTLPSDVLLSNYFATLELEAEFLVWDGWSENRVTWQQFLELKFRKSAHWVDIYNAGIRVCVILKK
jgi:SAM-dependent methyltransferase